MTNTTSKNKTMPSDPEVKSAYTPGKKPGIPLWVISLIAIILLLVIIVSLILLRSININEDFNRPWWVWLIMISVIAIIAWMLSPKKPKFGGITFKHRKVPVEMIWSFIGIIIVVFLFAKWGPTTKYWHDMVPRAQNKTTDRVITTSVDGSLVSKPYNFVWGRNYFLKGDTLRFFRGSSAVVFTPESKSDRKSEVWVFKTKEPSLKRKIRFSQQTGVEDHYDVNDDFSPGEYYFVVTRSAYFWVEEKR